MSNRLQGYLLPLALVLSLFSSPKTTIAEGKRQYYVQDFTAYTLKSGQVKLGFSSDVGLTDSLSIGVDNLALAAGSPNLKFKFNFWNTERHSISAGGTISYLNRETALWGFLKDHFDTLEAQIFRPQISWSQRISPRLILHSHWSIGIGTVNAELSEEGRRHFWESKYPQGNYATRTKVVNPDDNQEANLGLAHRTLQAQSLMGLSRDFFQVSGEFQRDTDKRVLLTSRISNLQLEQLKSQDFRVTAAQEWQHGPFNFRLGLGVLYQVLSGNDLDGESVDDAGFLPVGDFDIYWVF